MPDTGGREHRAGSIQPESVTEASAASARTSGAALAGRALYCAPILVVFDLRTTQGDTGAQVDGALGAYFTSGGGPA